MNYRKLFPLCLLALGFGLSACGSDDETDGLPEEPATRTEVNPEKVFTLGVPSCDAAGNVIERDAQGRVVKLGDFASFDYTPSAEGAAVQYDATVTYSISPSAKSVARLVLNPQGFVSRAIEQPVDTIWYTDFTYSTDGRVIRMDEHDSHGIRTNREELEYENGDLVRVHIEDTRKTEKDDYEITFAYTSERYPIGHANKGAYVFVGPLKVYPYGDADGGLLLDEVLYYAGLLGHTTMRLPLQRKLVVITSQEGSERTDTQTTSYVWEIDREGYPLRYDYYVSGVEDGQSYLLSLTHNYHWR